MAVRAAARALALNPVAEEDVAAPTVSPIQVGDRLEKKVQTPAAGEAQHTSRRRSTRADGPHRPYGQVGYTQFLLATLSALESTLREVGRKVQPGACLAAAQEELYPEAT